MLLAGEENQGLDSDGLEFSSMTIDIKTGDPP
jgi:hypothetical protein